MRVLTGFMDTSFKRQNVNVFYDNLRDVPQRTESFEDGTRVYNIDETYHDSSKMSLKCWQFEGEKGSKDEDILSLVILILPDLPSYLPSPRKEISESSFQKQRSPSSHFRVSYIIRLEEFPLICSNTSLFRHKAVKISKLINYRHESTYLHKSSDSHKRKWTDYSYCPCTFHWKTGITAFEVAGQRSTHEGHEASEYL